MPSSSLGSGTNHWGEEDSKGLRINDSPQYLSSTSIIEEDLSRVQRRKLGFCCLDIESRCSFAFGHYYCRRYSTFRSRQALRSLDVRFLSSSLSPACVGLFLCRVSSSRCPVADGSPGIRSIARCSSQDVAYTTVGLKFLFEGELALVVFLWMESSTTSYILRFPAPGH